MMRVNFYRNLKSLLLVCFLLLLTAVFAAIPTGYYDNAEGKTDAELKTALHLIIKPHTVLEYYASATYFRTTDWHPDGYFWDMYSTNKRSTWSGMNREHNLPKSWWSTNPESTVAYSDLHNLYTSDATANTAKSNFPPGKVGTASYNQGNFKVGSNVFPGYGGQVFEPANEYKGDFARAYMYMVTCYQDYATQWRSLGTSSMLQNNTYPVFNTYAINLLMQWHRQDPVSEKERVRNDAVYSFQFNRNPFVDFPHLAEYIWGNLKKTPWYSDINWVSPDDFYLNYNNGTLFVNINQLTTAHYKVYNSNGMVQQEGVVADDSKIEVGELPYGVYIAVIYSDKYRFTSKFVVAK